jgi:hypothetical protein
MQMIGSRSEIHVLGDCWRNCHPGPYELVLIMGWENEDTKERHKTCDDFSRGVAGNGRLYMVVRSGMYELDGQFAQVKFAMVHGPLSL